MGAALILTGRKFEEIGRAIYGDVWVSMLAKRLRRTKRTIMRWRDGPAAPPPVVRQALIDLIDEQFAILGDKRSQLAEVFDDVA